MLKTIRSFARADRLVKAVVKFDCEYDEYQIYLFKAGRAVKNATYHTDDLQDALGTAQLMVTA